MSQENTKLEILKAKCCVKYSFLMEHSLVNEDEKCIIKSVSSSVKRTDGFDMIEAFDGFLSDCLTIAKLRQESENIKTLSPLKGMLWWIVSYLTWTNADFKL